MEEIIGTYEVLFAVSVKNGEEATQTAVERIRNLIADNAKEIVAEDVWGKRRFAYPIHYETEGYYVLCYFRSTPEFPAELTRVLGITEGVLRFIVLTVDEKKQKINVKVPEETTEEVEAPAADETAAATDDEIGEPVEEIEEAAAPESVG
ncbi:MAG: 30S ribosomal protein S6 [Clostridia bacterium]|nr:30S ribosomal protein S6 [Clostridia bacterium]